jgi:hypothetical protein
LIVDYCIYTGKRDRLKESASKTITAQCTWWRLFSVRQYNKLPVGAWKGLMK